MCGIAGTAGWVNRNALGAMARVLAHRGPEGESFYEDTDGQVGLVNRRLAIQDVEGGAQPMSNEDGSVVVVYNGEIYNYPALRQELLSKGHVLKTHCDTEVLPHLYEEHGIELLQRLNGIYAFALWDRRRRTLWLARDPLGVKPLVYACKDDRLAFGSEAKAILASGLIDARLDEASLHLSMNLRYVPGERTLFAGIRRVPPGSVLRVEHGTATVHRVVSLDWTPDEQPTENTWVEGIRAHVEDAVERQLLADVEVGVSLSGGIDSSAVVAMIRRHRSGTLRTFTLGFNEPWDENEPARRVAERFGTTHHDVVLTEPAMGHLRDAIYYTEEPKVNCLQLYLLHRFIGRHVKVVLGGLGGDELFAGYDFYAHLRRLAPVRALVPSWLGRRVLSPAADALARAVSGIGRPGLDLAARGVEWIGSIHDPVRHYLLLRNAWDFNPALLRRVYTAEFRERLTTRCRDEYQMYFPGVQPVESEALRAEMSTKLVNDLLHNEDTMSMAHSVESRVPLLDLELVRFAARIPHRIRFGRGMKGLFKAALRGILPEDTLSRRKWGFTVDPVEQYRKDLRPMALEWLSPDRVRRAGIFEPAFVKGILSARPHQRMRWHYFMLWQMIGFEMWRDLFLGQAQGQPVSRDLGLPAARLP
jgi:asparagine synthase (glutamine-hydrolysing)